MNPVQHTNGAPPQDTLEDTVKCLLHKTYVGWLDKLPCPLQDHSEGVVQCSTAKMEAILFFQNAIFNDQSDFLLQYPCIDITWGVEEFNSLVTGTFPNVAGGSYSVLWCSVWELKGSYFKACL